SQELLLPQGYPESVSPDYLQYQCWDSLQALCSSLSGALGTRAVLQALGVGDGAATATGATLSWVLRVGGTGVIMGGTGVIMGGTGGDAEGDGGEAGRLHWSILVCSGPYWSVLVRTGLFWWVQCVVGVAGGATRAALALHQARRDNVADVAAKDSSQETLVNGVGLLLALLLLPLLDGRPGQAELRKALESGTRDYFIVLRPSEGWAGVGLRRGAPPDAPLRGCCQALLLELLLGPAAPTHISPDLRALQESLRHCSPGSVPWGALAESSRLWEKLGPAFLEGRSGVTSGWSHQGSQ
ncbi:RUS1 protein, partial [Psilopogon haemacephalus]|nr:RUS1 protein [Psilopogon haemacephalus]